MTAPACFCWLTWTCWPSARESDGIEDDLVGGLETGGGDLRRSAPSSCAMVMGTRCDATVADDADAQAFAAEEQRVGGNGEVAHCVRGTLKWTKT